jgi:hypothetical protein
MSLKTYIIELRIDFNDDARADLMLTGVRQQAKELLTTARLLADGRKPDISISNNDIYIGREEIDLFTKEEKEEYGIA